MSSNRPSPSNSSSPPNNSNSPFLPTSFGANSSAQTAMGADAWRSPVERRPMEKNSVLLSPAATIVMEEKPTAIYIRKLPVNTSEEALQSMLLFAKDLVNATFVQARYTEDNGYKTAVAHFKTLGGAQEARDRLNGKANANNDAKMLIELAESPGTIGPRRNTVDGVSRQGTGPMSNGQGRSRYNGTFEKMSPPSTTPGLGNGDFSVGEPLQNLFSPTSPVASAFPPPARGKALINGDGEDDSDGLLQESMGIGTGHTIQPATRRTTNPSMPISRFNSLSLNTTHGANGLTSPPVSSFASPRSAVPGQSPAPSINGMSPHPMGNMGHANSYQPFGPQFARPANYPPVNPADQNPPCNTLYVGNLPIDTSEDELKAMFSKQRGYKRLCFRTKQNGPMCFVEFEDVSFATKALNELYGYPLHNSVKGGIRLSFSKNPLGVRTGQNNNIGPATPLTPQASMPGMPNGMGLASFSTATGPPPGLAAPPGLHSAGGMSSNNSFGMFTNGGFAGTATEVSSPMRSQPLTGVATSVAGNGFGGMGGGYQNYMMGR